MPGGMFSILFLARLLRRTLSVCRMSKRWMNWRGRRWMSIIDRRMRKRRRRRRRRGKQRRRMWRRRMSRRRSRRRRRRKKRIKRKKR